MNRSLPLLLEQASGGVSPAFGSPGTYCRPAGCARVTVGIASIRSLWPALPASRRPARCGVLPRPDTCRVLRGVLRLTGPTGRAT